MELTEKIAEYNIAILGVSETKKTGPSYPGINDNVIYYTTVNQITTSLL